MSTETQWKSCCVIPNLHSQSTGDEVTIESSGRGGSSMCAVDDKVVIFGGANRSQVHFADVWVMDIASLLNKSHASPVIHMVNKFN